MPKFRFDTHVPEFNQSLADHLRSAGWAVYTEIPLGASTMEKVGRADVLALKKSYNVRAVVYECKTSRGDFQRDVNAGKYERYFTAAHQVYFAVPQGLVKKDEIPAHCGLIVRTENKGWHTVKGATVHSTEIPYTLLLACLFREQEEKAEVRRLRDRINLQDNVELSMRAKNLGREIAKKLEDVQREWASIKEAKTAIEEYLGNPSNSLTHALSDLRHHIKQVKTMDEFPTAVELVGLANDLISTRFGTFMRDRIPERLLELAQELNENKEKPDA